MQKPAEQPSGALVLLLLVMAPLWLSWLLTSSGLSAVHRRLLVLLQQLLAVPWLALSSSPLAPARPLSPAALPSSSMRLLAFWILQLLLRQLPPLLLLLLSPPLPLSVPSVSC
jgi:hypothetical protein